MKPSIIILDFGSQYTQLIGRKVRELGHYCEIWPYTRYDDIDEDVKGVILAGSPSSCKLEGAPYVDVAALLTRTPVLGICYGAQLAVHQFGGEVMASTHREYGPAELVLTETSPWATIGDISPDVWMSHGDSIVSLPDGWQVIAGSTSIPIAAYHRPASDGRYELFGVQFHPEVHHTTDGKMILQHFVRDIAGASPDWSAGAYIDETIGRLRAEIGDEDHVMMALSGGVDSTVAATLLHRAIGDRLHCVYIDTGLQRKNEYEEVLEIYGRIGLNITGVEAADRYYKALADVADPERKRKIIGHLFIELFEEYASKLPSIKWLGQGTIYPDVIESVSVHGPSVTIKSHHNVGGLPEHLQLDLVEPLRMLFKDEVRRIGAALGLPHDIIGRHPFPGPGLAIRILGPVDAESVNILQEADHIYVTELKKAGWYDRIWQAGAILLPIQSVGVMGDERTYERVLALRAVNSVDGMTAHWTHIDYAVLGRISSKIINQVKGINRVVYDISTKPPSTIEWE